jgi:hypothetical protein
MKKHLLCLATVISGLVGQSAVAKTKVAAGKVSAEKITALKATCTQAVVRNHTPLTNVSDGCDCLVGKIVDYLNTESTQAKADADLVWVQGYYDGSLSDAQVTKDKFLLQEQLDSFGEVCLSRYGKK